MYVRNRDSAQRNEENKTPANGSLGDAGDEGSSQSSQNKDTGDSDSESDENGHYDAVVEAACDTQDASARHTDTREDDITTKRARAQDTASVRVHTPHQDVARIHDARTSKGSGETASTQPDEQHRSHGGDAGGLGLSASNTGVGYVDVPSGRRPGAAMQRNDGSSSVSTTALENTGRSPKVMRVRENAVGQTDERKDGEPSISLP